MKRLKVLIIAHELSPTQGSECAEGWSLVTRLAQYHEITVLYASGSQFNYDSYKLAIDNYFKDKNLINGLEFINIDQPRLTKLTATINKVFRKIGGIGLPLLYFMGYRFWQKKAYKRAKVLHKKENFDIVHQLTQITFREPGYTWKLDIPYVWGPTGGISTLPVAYRKSLTGISKILEYIRTFSNFYQSRYVGRIKEAIKRALLIYAFSKEDAEYFSKRTNCKIKLMLDAGSHIREDIHRENNTENKIKGIWVGRLVDRKAPLILLKALSLLKQRNINVEFTIIGKGPLENKLQKMLSHLKLTNVRWIKQVNHHEVINYMKESDFFVHTSFREATSNVIPEALSIGMPILCHDINGMSIAINESCGIKVPLISPEISIKGFAEAMSKLISDRTLLRNLKEGALNRAKEISWDNMAKEIANDYLQIIHN